MVGALQGCSGVFSRCGIEVSQGYVAVSSRSSCYWGKRVSTVGGYARVQLALPSTC